jgi:hypothetical protein
MTKKFQLWQNKIMITLISQSEASELISTGAYRIINSQAIEWIGDIDIGC